jgi:hypothetical protein
MRGMHPLNATGKLTCRLISSHNKKSKAFQTKSRPAGAERHRAPADLIGPLIIQDGILGAGLRAHASGARFGTCVDSSEQCSAKIFILLTISSSPEFFGYFKLHRRTFSPSSRHDAIPLGLCGPLCSSIPCTPGNELNLFAL